MNSHSRNKETCIYACTLYMYTIYMYMYLRFMNYLLWCCIKWHYYNYLLCASYYEVSVLLNVFRITVTLKCHCHK